MAMQIYRPPFPLSQHVEMIWSLHGEASKSLRKRIFPSGAMELVIHLERRACSFFDERGTHRIEVPLLAGPYSSSFQIDPSEFSNVIGIRFLPGSGRLVFPCAAHELHNRDIPLSEVNPKEADRLLNELCSATGRQAQLRVAEQFLQRQLARAKPIHPAVRYAVAHLSQNLATRIQDLNSSVGLSHTRLIQLFREQVGLTPTLFRRIRRFGMVIERIERRLPVDWSALAADCGYFDQAHLIRDFRAFSGITPSKFSTKEDLRPDSDLTQIV